MSKPNTKELKEAIEAAEEKLTKLDSNSKKHKKISRMLETSYAILNNEISNEEIINKKAKKLWILLEEEDSLLIWVFVFGFLLSGALVFTVYQSYAFIKDNWDNPNHHPIHPNKPEINEELSRMVTVNYKETNIVNLYNLLPVSDQEGLKNTPQEFNISNSSKKVPNLDYKIDYNVNIVELNSNITKLIDKKYIKYQIIYKDNSGKEVRKPIGTFADLKKNPDGSYHLFTGSQKKDSITDFKVIIWLSAIAGNDQQGASYMFMFKVNAIIARD